ncbi:DUF3089 domain-containing protein [uncultured Pseudodesulfovibrio sp.]|uniref:DUF3089 domain-containing protein n=1 Tax=uncultured Pseudodesulfovibrio sp. TaxID=2035858 RepID=UPI0029C6C649|nr:DUF3089 domain-containing protein [uncultured Pseudodesulfovibrio sp.]
MQRPATALSVFLTLLLLASHALAEPHLPPFSADNTPAAPDYAKRTSWLAQPDTPDTHPVDIFWVYPTVLHDDVHWLMPPSNTRLQKAAANTLTTQASVFTGQANLYAPFYRQMNMAGLSLPQKDVDSLISYGMDDVFRAFTYYLNNLNQGRPFILAGHSQGSDILLEILVRHWGQLGVEDRLIAGYIIGWSITTDDLAKNPTLTLCENATQTGCFITYNSVAPDRQDVAPTIRPGSVVTNPLSWKTDGTLAPAELNIGSVFFNDDGTTTTVHHFTSAQAKDSGLVVRPMDLKLVTPDMAKFPEGVYHFYDYSLFYENLKQNVFDRINAFTTN